jgi:aspartyl-tRNA(Asn)/glutamyl-tRNA(Gln) amidotransferase subunit A
MASQALAVLSAHELAAHVRARKASPIEVVDDVLRRIDLCEPQLNAFVVLDRDGAKSAAREVEAALMRGEELGPLCGVPLTIKDIQDVKGLPTRRGSRLTSPVPATADSALVSRLRAAGAVIIGKTTMTDNAWTAVSDSPLTGSTHNPWRRGLTSGGSSSGAAALAAAGCGPLHLGTDGAGSIRLPAHFCGVIGFKPTFGTVPYTPTPNNGLLSHAGPIARSVDDAELMLEVMAGPYALDLFSHPLGYQRRPPTSMKGTRVAFSLDLGHARVDPDISECVARSVRVFEDVGARVEEVVPPWGASAPALIRELWGPALMGAARTNAADTQMMDAGLVACLRNSAGRSWPDIHASYGRRLAFAAEVGRWFDEGWDLLVTPTASVTAFAHGRQQPAHWPEHEWDWLSWAEFTHPFNMSHSPAVTVPCGLSCDGLPIGLQIVGPRFSDSRVMNAARLFLQARPISLPDLPLN